MRGRVLTTLRQLRTRPATREDRNIRHLMLQTGLVGVVNGGVVTFLPIFLARLGASAMAVSLLTSLPALVTIVLALPSGTLVARWRQIVPPSAQCFWMLRFCYLGVGLAGLLNPRIAPTLIVLIWGLSAIPSTIGNTVFYDVVAGSVPPRRRAAVNGARWALLGFASAASVALYGQLLEALPMPGNYLLVFTTSFGAGMLSTWFYSRLEVPEREPAADSGPRLPLRARIAGLLQPLTDGGGFLSYSLVTFVMRIGLFLGAGIWSIFLVREITATDAWIGWRTTVECSALTIGYYFWGRIVSRFGHSRVFVLVCAALGVCGPLASFATHRSMWLLLVVAVISGFFASGIDVTLFEEMLAIMPPGERPRYVAMNTALANLVAFAAPIAGATIAGWVGIRPVLFAGGVCVFATAALASRFMRARVPRSKEALAHD